MEEFSDFKQDFYTFDGKEFSHDPMMTIVDSDGNEFQVEDRITFSIDGADSVMTRITNRYEFKPYTSSPNEDVMDTLVGTWTWGYALGDTPNKQIITTNFEASGMRHYRVTVLTNDEFVYQDQTWDNTTYHYSKL